MKFISNTIQHYTSSCYHLLGDFAEVRWKSSFFIVILPSSLFIIIIALNGLTFLTASHHYNF